MTSIDRLPSIAKKQCEPPAEPGNAETIDAIFEADPVRDLGFEIIAKART